MKSSLSTLQVAKLLGITSQHTAESIRMADDFSGQDNSGIYGGQSSARPRNGDRSDLRTNGSWVESSTTLPWILGYLRRRRSYFFLMRSSSFLRSFAVIGVTCVSPADAA
jgi:hypothetical protein